jgi:hypothetical protein
MKSDLPSCGYGEGTPIIKLSPCAFCGEPSTSFCEWPVNRPRRVIARDLNIGDRIKRFTESDTKAAKRGATVISIHPIDPEERQHWIFPLRITIQTETGRVKTFETRGYSEVLRVEEQPCGARVCEMHLRRPEPGVEYCADHWKSWEAVS